MSYSFLFYYFRQKILLNKSAQIFILYPCGAWTLLPRHWVTGVAATPPSDLTSFHLLESDCTEHTKQVPASGHLNWWFLISVISTRRVLWLYMGLDSKDTLPKKPSLVTVFYTVRFSLPGPCHTLFHYSFSFIYFHRTHLYLFNATAPPATLSPSRTGPTARFYIPRMSLELVDI